MFFAYFYSWRCWLMRPTWLSMKNIITYTTYFTIKKWSSPHMQCKLQIIIAFFFPKLKYCFVSSLFFCCCSIAQAPHYVILRYSFSYEISNLLSIMTLWIFICYWMIPSFYIIILLIHVLVLNKMWMHRWNHKWTLSLDRSDLRESKSCYESWSWNPQTCIFAWTDTMAIF